MSNQPREVLNIIKPETVMEGAGVRLKRSIATAALDHLDPFLLFDHFGSENPADYIKGFPMHPHRGIETVTYMINGNVNHQDSIGNAGTIGSGDVQWMTAGGGIMHEEMPQRAEGEMIGFQLWVNLPARLKMTTPRYQEISSRQIPSVSRTGGVDPGNCRQRRWYSGSGIRNICRSGLPGRFGSCRRGFFPPGGERTHGVCLCI